MKILTNVSRGALAECNKVCHPIDLTIPKRYVSDRELFEKLVEESLKLKTTRTAIGGNAPVIANRMAREGAKVVLGGQESDDMKEGFFHLPSKKC